VELSRSKVMERNCFSAENVVAVAVTEEKYLA